MFLPGSGVVVWRIVSSRAALKDVQGGSEQEERRIWVDDGAAEGHVGWVDRRVMGQSFGSGGGD